MYLIFEDQVTCTSSFLPEGTRPIFQTNDIFFLRIEKAVIGSKNKNISVKENPR